MQPDPATPVPPPRPDRFAPAHPVAARIASGLAVFTVIMLVWFALYNIIDIYRWNGGWSGLLTVNVLGAALGAGVLLVAAGFTYARRVPGAWTLSALCWIYVLSFLVAAPLLFDVPFARHWQWIFGFEKSNGVAVLLALVSCLLTAITATVAASVRTPPRR